jgi:hypothetical protein
MSRLTIGILGTFALLLSLGAAQFALGRDLTQADPDRSGTSAGYSINRSGKADRAAKAVASVVQMQTFALQLNGFSDGPANPQSPPLIKPANTKAMVACEPVVSLLTEIARQLQPGRCVT